MRGPTLNITAHYSSLASPSETADNSGTLAVLAAIRRASSAKTIKLSPAQSIAQISLADDPCRRVCPFLETPYESFRSGHRL